MNWNLYSALLAIGRNRGVASFSLTEKTPYDYCTFLKYIERSTQYSEWNVIWVTLAVLGVRRMFSGTYYALLRIQPPLKSSQRDIQAKLVFFFFFCITFMFYFCNLSMHPCINTQKKATASLLVGCLQLICESVEIGQPFHSCGLFAPMLWLPEHWCSVSPRSSYPLVSTECSSFGVRLSEQVGLKR